MAKYDPPRQSGIGQLFDSAFLMALVFLALFAPLWIGLAGSGKIENEEIKKQTTWTGLGQNETQAKAWEALGSTPESAATAIATRFDYVIDPFTLGATALLILGYFLVVLRFSKTEYQDVIDERFGKK
jgi:hypothetical protein